MASIQIFHLFWPIRGIIAKPQARRIERPTLKRCGTRADACRRGIVDES
jgi:hypothetical protein